MRIKNFADIGGWNYGGSIAYPDEVSFAYNPNFVIVNFAGDIVPEYVSIEFGGKDIEVALYNGYAKAYISGIMALMFKDIAIERARRTYLRIKTPDGDLLLQDAITVVCGGLRMDQRMNDNGVYIYNNNKECYTRKLQWFKNFPMLVSVLRPTQDSTLSARYDGNRYDDSIFTFRYSISDVDYSTTLPGAPAPLSIMQAADTIHAMRPDLPVSLYDKVNLGTIVVPTNKDIDKDIYPEWPSNPPTTGGDIDGDDSTGGEGGDEGGEIPGDADNTTVSGVVYFANFGIFLKKSGEEYSSEWESFGTYGATDDYIDVETGKALTGAEWNYNGHIVKIDTDTGQLYYTGFGFAGRNGIIDLNPALSFPEARFLSVYRLKGNKKAGSTFDQTFDYTFQRLADTDVLIELVIREEKCGKYIRWIDSNGYVMYYLFSDGTTSYKSDQSDDTVDATGEYGGMYFEAERSREIESTISVTCCATFLDRETFLQVVSVINACHVDMFLGYTRGGREIWQPVKVEGGNVTIQDNAVLHEVKITITYKQYTQQI